MERDYRRTATLIGTGMEVKNSESLFLPPEVDEMKADGGTQITERLYHWNFWPEWGRT